ncbi:MAG TPA: S1 RNA-binding domain-containing protein, partial [Desulfosalsimonadaceae bacterium]|nr:S1 RNA-binding domain-containing protein [Desulfosalsimonadaceae bacterium]
SEMSQEDLMALYEETFRGFEAGEIVEGRVVEIEDERVLIDIGYKAEGEVDRSEFLDADGSFHLSVGDTVEVLLVQKDEDGYPVLSRKNVETARRLNELAEKYEAGEPVSGRIVSQKKGGFIVDMGALRAFLPASQLDVGRISDFSAWVDTEQQFLILQFDKKNQNIVLSRRALVEQERQRRKEEALERLSPGDVVEGTISNITDYGLFVDLGGIVGLVHVSNLSWTQVKHPASLYETGETITVQVLDIDRQNQKVTLGVKQLIPNPWDDLHERYPVGSVIAGSIKKIKDFGVFVAIEEGINGLVHVSDLSWDQEVKKPSQHYKKGETVQAKILDIDRENQRVRLGIKQLHPHPWQELAQRYLPGAWVSGTVSSVASFGLFVEIEEGVQGLVHVSEVPAEKGRDPLENFAPGQTINARVLEVLPEEKRIRLTLKPGPEDSGELGRQLQQQMQAHASEKNA